MSENGKDAVKTAKRAAAPAKKAGGLKKDDIPATKRSKKTEDLETALPRRTLRSGAKESASELVSLTDKPKSGKSTLAPAVKSKETASKEKKESVDSKKGKSTKGDAATASNKTEKNNDVSEESAPEEETVNGNEKLNGDEVTKGKKPAATKATKGRPAAKTAGANKTEKNVVPEEEEKMPEEEAKANVDATSKAKKVAPTNKGSKGRAAKVVMEHWKAVEIRDYVSKFLAFPFELNPTKPRRQSFEIRVVDVGGNDHLIWSGVKKGPPRALKFPTPELILEELSAFN